MRKIKDENFYRVVNKDTGKILAKKTTIIKCLYNIIYDTTDIRR